MADSSNLEHAWLKQLDAKFEEEIKRENWVQVQFNPETLKVSFANQVATPQGAGDTSGSPSRQFVGAGTTKLSLQLWFDVTALPDTDQTDDVRKLTEKVAYFITPEKEKDGFVPPAVRFQWGTFQFDGLMDSMEESLEFFSGDGRPLRASVSVGLSQQKITKYAFGKPGKGAGGGAGGGAPKTPGTNPLAEAQAGVSLQAMADVQGAGGNWQAVASANGIENPRLLPPGQLIDFNVSVKVGK